MASITWTGITLDATIARKVDAAADRAGVPRNFLRAIVLEESGGDPAIVGDNGASVGLLQLHEAGQGAGMTKAERKDPDRNLAAGMPAIRDAWRVQSGITPLRERVKAAAGLAGHPNMLDAGEPYRERIARRWELLQAENPDPAGTVNLGPLQLDSTRIEAKVQGAIDYARAHPLQAAGVALGAAVLLMI